MASNLFTTIPQCCSLTNTTRGRPTSDYLVILRNSNSQNINLNKSDIFSCILTFLICLCYVCNLLFYCYNVYFTVEEIIIWHSQSQYTLCLLIYKLYKAGYLWVFGVRLTNRTRRAQGLLKVDPCSGSKTTYAWLFQKYLKLWWHSHKEVCFRCHVINLIPLERVRSE